MSIGSTTNKAHQLTSAIWAVPTRREVTAVQNLLGSQGGRWCRNAEAEGPDGEPAWAREDDACRFCLLGAFLRVCGIERLRAMLPYLAREVCGMPINDNLISMTVLQRCAQTANCWRVLMDWNDDPERAFHEVSFVLRFLAKRSGLHAPKV